MQQKNEVLAKKIHSPSSINLYKQCPRRYYYTYIEKIPTKPSIHLLRGSIVHSVLEDFFKVDINNISEQNFIFEFNVLINELFIKYWKQKKEELESLNIDNLEFYFNETKTIINNWITNFISNLIDKIQDYSLKEAFGLLQPKTEVEFISEKYNVKGYIDAIYEGDEIILLDYKTSSRYEFTEEYKLQMAIYALLYKEKHNKLPDKVGINFLKFGEKYMKVDNSLIEFAKQKCKWISEKTKSTNIEDYPKKESGLCKWSNGQCDFYDICFK
jgi:putative RecB family exonuclease